MTLSILDLIIANEENTALTINAITPGTYAPCDFCERLTCKPYRTFEEHNADFCSEACMHRYIEEHEEDRGEEAMEFANATMSKYEKKWEKFQDLLCGEAEGPVEHKDVLVDEIWLTTEPDEEDSGGIETNEGYVKVSYRNADAYYVCDCICKTCNLKFEIKALTLINTKKTKICPVCSKIKHKQGKNE